MGSWQGSMSCEVTVQSHFVTSNLFPFSAYYLCSCWESNQLAVSFNLNTPLLYFTTCTKNEIGHIIMIRYNHHITYTDNKFCHQWINFGIKMSCSKNWIRTNQYKANKWKKIIVPFYLKIFVLFWYISFDYCSLRKHVNIE